MRVLAVPAHRHRQGSIARAAAGYTRRQCLPLISDEQYEGSSLAGMSQLRLFVVCVPAESLHAGSDALRRPPRFPFGPLAAQAVDLAL